MRTPIAVTAHPAKRHSVTPNPSRRHTHRDTHTSHLTSINNLRDGRDTSPRTRHNRRLPPTKGPHPTHNQRPSTTRHQLSNRSPT